MKGEGGRTRLTHLQRYATEADQLAFGAGHRCHLVARIELHHLRAGDRTGVGDRDGHHRHLCGGASGDVEVRVLEGRGRESEPERVQRLGGAVGVVAPELAATTAGAGCVVHGYLADRRRQAHRKAPGRRGLTEQDPRQRSSRFHARDPRDERRAGERLHRAECVHAARTDHCHRRCARGGHPLKQFQLSAGETEVGRIPRFTDRGVRCEARLPPQADHCDVRAGGHLHRRCDAVFVVRFGCHRAARGVADLGVGTQSVSESGQGRHHVGEVRARGERPTRLG